MSYLKKHIEPRKILKIQHLFVTMNIKLTYF